MKTTLLTLLSCVLIATSCTKEIANIEPIYDYVLDATPTQSTISQGERVEIRCKLLKNLYYDSDARFTLRYVQRAGVGALSLLDRVVEQGEVVELPSNSFELYYISYCTEMQLIELYIEDEFGNLSTQIISFTSSDIAE